MDRQSILIQMGDENIETEFVAFAFQFLIGSSIWSGQARQRRHFCY
jgi:hypothetical protein